MFRDTMITAKVKRRELIIFGASFLMAFLLNVIGIIKHNTQVKELFTQIHIVLLVTLVIYGLVAILRVLYHLMAMMWNRK
jgi:hypothetical protein